MRHASVLAILSTFVAAFAAADAADVAAAAGVRGVVRTLLRPIEGVHVVIHEAGRLAESDSLGRYDLGPLAPGLYGITLAAVGYESATGTVTVGADSSAPPGDWLLKPLRPDGEGATGGLTVPPAPGTGPPGPGTIPLGPGTGLFLTPGEMASRMPGALGELLPQIALSDSITFDSGGTGAPGYETWSQWSERLAPLAVDTSGAALGTGVGVTARRVQAYTRTRAALAAGPTWGGYQYAKLARAAIDAAQRDVARGAPGASFLITLSDRLDTEFQAGKEPPRPKPQPAKRVRRRGSRRR